MSREPERRAGIRAIATAFPATVVANATLLADTPPGQLDVLLQRTGVVQRHIAAEDETALDLAETACRRLIADHPTLPEQLDTLIFCTQSADYVMPANCCLLHGRLDLPETVAAFDLTHGCSGWVYGIKLAQVLIASGQSDSVLLVTSETYSKIIHPQDRSARLLFGDGAAVTWLTPASGTAGVHDVDCRTAGQHYKSVLIPAGGCRQPVTDALRRQEDRDSSGNVRSPCHIHISGRDILSFVADRIPANVREVVERNKLTLDQIDWFVFHQASSVVLDTLTSLLELDPARVLRHLESVGNTVSASIPITLKHAPAAQRIQPGHWVLLCGFGVGLSWGTVLLRW